MYCEMVINKVILFGLTFLASSPHNVSNEVTSDIERVSNHQHDSPSIPETSS